ncbi:hypothetical protein N5K37_24595 [Delftia tsuruhatensis]|uniref:hypothetical protein n=1 Tax=Delftia tsuruhatensis TaxID=180282 RepID=UPI0010542EEA|nr:hypothetical protein [Delftia tsuruhatensis]MDH2233092.1 hypothetical protein [Delftia tsuruhatensis]TDF28485.1 hypothetical protein EZI45_13660 [Delftia tsuruhatensis]
MKKTIAGCAIGVVFYCIGWVCGHQTIATECKRLGGFYVGDATFKCTAIQIAAPFQPPSAPPRQPL